MNVLDYMREWFNNNELLKEFNQSYDFLEQVPNNVGLFSNGITLLKQDIEGNSQYKMNLVLMSGMTAYADYDRLLNSEFMNKLTYQLATIKNIEIVENGRSGIITSVLATNGMMYSVPSGDINDGVIYQLQISVNYKLKGEKQND